MRLVSHQLQVLYVSITHQFSPPLSSMDDFSTNRHAENTLRPDSSSLLTRHPDLWFSDGNIVLVAGDFYFNVHRGLLCRHSTVLEEAINDVDAEDRHSCLIEGNTVLGLDEQPKDLCRFLMALYDGVYVFFHLYLRSSA